MRSFFSTTSELLDMPVAAQELLEGVNPEDLGKYSLGILFYDSEMEDPSEMLAAVHNALGFTIIGCSTLATLNSAEGITEMSSSLMVLTNDTCRFVAALSEPIAPENVTQRIAEVYADCTAHCEEKPDMLFTFPPQNYNIVLDIYPEELSRLSGGLPVFGGLPGQNSPYGACSCAFNGSVYTDRMVLVALEGGARPLFATGTELSHMAGGDQPITRAEGNLIYEVGGKPLTQYMEEIGIDPAKLVADETQILFVANPFMLTKPGIPREEYALVRTLHEIDMEKGCGRVIGLAPEGHMLTIGALTRKDIRTATESAVRELLAKIEKAEQQDPSYKYTAIIATSCLGRYMVMTPQNDVEGKAFKEQMPERLHFTGYYGYGELGPTHIQGGIATNTAQNESLTLCAL